MAILERIKNTVSKIKLALSSKLAILLYGVVLGVSSVVGGVKLDQYLESLKTPELDAYEAQIRARAKPGKELDECFIPRVRKEIGEQTFVEMTSNPIAVMLLNMQLGQIAAECKISAQE